MKHVCIVVIAAGLLAGGLAAEDFPKPYSAPAVERENVFAFTQKPVVKLVGKDDYEIAFAVKGNCDVTVDLVDGKGIVVRHLASGVLGANVPAPFQRNSLSQKIHWDGKDDLSVYVRDPEKLTVRVRLGLKAEFDKLLGGSAPFNIPGYILSVAVGPDAAYVFYKGRGSHGHVGARKFDRNGKYLAALVPPPAGTPEKNLGGMAYIEYEKGKKGLFGPALNETLARDAYVLPGVNGKSVGDEQIALVGDRLYFMNAGSSLLTGKGSKSSAYYIRTDGTTTVEGLDGRPVFEKANVHLWPRLAASPDGKWMYMLGVGEKEPAPVVFRWSIAGKEYAKAVIGGGKPGSDNKSLNRPRGLDVGPKGRVYVSDHANNRIQIFDGEGTYLKTIKCERPTVMRVHQKTGAIYVLHGARVRGKTVGRLTKFKSFDDPAEEFHHDGLVAACFAVDSWSAKPRLWLAGEKSEVNTGGASGSGPGLTVWEEDGKSVRKILDFDAEAKKAAGEKWFGKWTAAGGAGGAGLKTVCDPTRERVMVSCRKLFDIVSGKYLGGVRIPAHAYDDVIFDRRGYMHVHLNPGFDAGPGVLRVDPSQETKTDKGERYWPEVPYDYGIPFAGKYCEERKGILPVKDQPGAKYFQDGIGVNMRGDVAVQSYIYYVPKMDDVMTSVMADGRKPDVGCDSRVGKVRGGYAGLLRSVRKRQKEGEEVYFIKRRPGIPLAGGTVWIFDSTGELRQSCAVNAGDLINGTQIDEDGAIYFVNARPRLFDGKPFLGGQGGTVGKPDEKGNRYPFTGTLIKSKPGGLCRIMLEKAPVPMEPLPNRPADLLVINWPSGDGPKAWVEGAEWLYAGASPIVSVGCSCPTQRIHLDWYKRVFVPEQYRHSIGILDTAGNLVMHLGRFGNHDDALAMKPGTEDIPMTVVRFISGTDRYLCFEDSGERVIALKLEYHAKETAEINVH